MPPHFLDDVSVVVELLVAHHESNIVDFGIGFEQELRHRHLIGRIGSKGSRATADYDAADGQTGELIGENVGDAIFHKAFGF